MRGVICALVVSAPFAVASGCSDEGGTAGPPADAGGSTGGGGGGTADSTTCWPGTEMCAGACTDVLKDPANCGSCGSICSAGELCSVGQCAVECGGGTTFCGSFCVDVTGDPAHCGACDAACDAGELCSGGKCVAQCEGELEPCLGGCVDTSTNTQHCGACGNGCDTGACIDGSCWPAPALGADLVGFWRLEGNAQDDSSNGNHGTVFGATATTGKVGSAYQFGPGGCIAVPDSSTLDIVGAGAWSMLAWIQNAGGCASDRGIVINKEETYEVGVECATNLIQEAIQLSDGLWTWNGTGAVGTGSWRHVAVTWDGTTVRHYVDGAEVYTRALSGTFADRATGFGIGCRSVPPDGSAAGGSFFVGVIDEVLLYKRGLSAAEIAAYYAQSK